MIRSPQEEELASNETTPEPSGGGDEGNTDDDDDDDDDNDDGGSGYPVNYEVCMDYALVYLYELCTSWFVYMCKFMCFMQFHGQNM